MTIYVDTAMIPATVRNGSSHHTSRWCHLMSDQLDPEELHLFAESIGMKRSWFQPGRTSKGPLGRPLPAFDHYDVTLPKRALAIRMGAIEVSREGMTGLLKLRRELYKRKMEDNA